MSLVRVDVRIQSAVLNEIKALAADTQKKESEIIRDLIDTGLACKQAQTNPSKKQLSAFEEAILKNLSLLVSASNKMISNQYELNGSSYKTMQELFDSIKESAAIDFNKFKDTIESRS